MRLVSPSIEMEAAFVIAAEDYRLAGERYLCRERNRPDFEFARYIQSLQDQSLGIGLAPGKVPQTTFWLLDDEGNLLGCSRLRHWLTPELEQTAGHIGYDVPPMHRRQGFGTKLLALTLQKAEALGLSEVLLVCDEDNEGSERIIRSNGGRFDNAAYSADDGKIVHRYWIRCHPESELHRKVKET